MCTICSQKADLFAQLIICMLRFYYAYLGESIGNVFQKATRVGWFGDRYLDGFLGVAPFIAT